MTGSELVIPGEYEGTLIGFVAKYQTNLAKVMPEHLNSDAFLGMAASYIGGDRNLQEAAKVNPQSLILSLRECASLGHMPVKGVYDLVAFNDRNAPGGKSVVGIEEYRGVIDRMYRAGGVRSVHVDVVRANDFFVKERTLKNPGPIPVHEYDVHADDSDRGALKGVYAYADMGSGQFSGVIHMGRSRIAKHRAVAKSAKFWGPPESFDEQGNWVEGPWTEDMWKKTALHKLETIVPTSTAYMVQRASVEAIKANTVEFKPDAATPPDPEQPEPDPSDSMTYDGEVIDDAGGSDDWPEPRKPPSRQG